MECEIEQLDLRYDRLRVQCPRRLKRLVASISDVGQLVPIVVVPSDQDRHRHIVIDGFKRIKALRRLHRDIVRATSWELSEIEALLLYRSQRTSQGETALEQAWLLDELRRRFGLTLEDLSRHFDRTPSWVSRRLGLVRELPATVQDHIRRGQIVPHAATKYLVPLARANPQHCERLSGAVARARLSSREVGELYAAWRDSSQLSRERLIEDPLLFLRSRQALDDDGEGDGPREGLLKDVALIAATARRARRRLGAGAVPRLAPADREAVLSGLSLARAEIGRLLETLHDEETTDARPQHTDSDPETQEEGALDTTDSPDPEDLPGSGPRSPEVADA